MRSARQPVRTRRLLLPGALVALVLTTLCATGSARGNDDHFVAGGSAVISGGVAGTWARVNGNGDVIWVGLTIPLSMVESMPPPGTGPSHAVAVLEYPPLVRETTSFNHVEIHSNPSGHPTNPNFADRTRFSAPHFDFHFYRIPAVEVAAIPGGFFPVPASPDLVPAGYAQPDPNSVPQMGRHCAPLSEFSATDPWQLTMVAGFLPNASSMHFVEPMITREFLLRRENFTMPVPTPASLGGVPIRYPSECVVSYDRTLDAYHMVFKGFEWRL